MKTNAACDSRLNPGWEKQIIKINQTIDEI